MKTTVFVLAVLLVLIPASVYAQPWSGILAPSRATDWRGAGVQGGIPTRTTICATIAPYTGTAATINNAISACPVNQVVFLQAGTFTLSSGINFSKSGVTLRGAGASETRLFVNGAQTNECGLGLSFAVGMCSGSGNGGQGPDHTATWTAAGGPVYPQGTNVITMSSVTGLQVGNLLILDQQNDASDGYPATGDIYVCENQAPCNREGGNNYARAGRVQVQLVTVTAINGNQVTFSPGLRAPNWRASQNPGAFWATTVLKNSGIEDLTVDFSSGGRPGLVFSNAMNCWVKGTRWLKTNSTGSQVFHIFPYHSARITIRDNYLYGPTAQANTQYAFTPHVTSDLLFENNILHHNVSPMTPNDPDAGSVYGYNYVNDTFYTGAGLILHSAGDIMNLAEGNNMSSANADVFHGRHHFNTWFRNHLDGWTANQNGVSSNSAVDLRTGSRFFNVIGNVIGHSHFSTYQVVAGARTDNAVFLLGPNDGSDNIGSDTHVNRTLMRWGNWDSVSNGTRFVASEVPSAITNFPNPVPGSQTLPASLYYDTRPFWWVTPWGTPPWPPIGPDVSGGDVTNAPTGGHANKIPARLCFENTSVDPAYPSSNPRILLFNGSSCYQAGGEPPPTPPAAPSGLILQ